VVVRDTGVELRNHPRIDEFAGDLHKNHDALGNADRTAKRWQIVACQRATTPVQFSRRKLRFFLVVGSYALLGPASSFLRLVPACGRSDRRPMASEGVVRAEGHIPDAEVAVPASKRNVVQLFGAKPSLAMVATLGGGAVLCLQIGRLLFSICPPRKGSALTQRHSETRQEFVFTMAKLWR
jgi:hypothetical protein